MSRWIRLDIGWWESDWLCVLSAEARLAWVMFLGRTKAQGSRGRTKAASPELLARQWLIGEEAVRQMLKAAEQAGAVVVEDGHWQVVKWAEYQGDDPTHAQRQAAYRERKKGAADPATSDGSDAVTPSRDASDDDIDIDNDIDSDKRVTTPHSPTGSTPLRRGVAPMVRPSVDDCRAYAAELGMPESEGSTFFDFHTSKGWKVGPSAMKDWRAALRTWRARWAGDKSKPTPADHFKRVMAEAEAMGQ